ncbi:PREDICTED: uncharacterized protein LOC105143178 [Acromyrmex echinatior]|uniref:uncharacterized protein LOC105143178 n=1 Tax=Acromyrmex echinatior TaxID=103372 RepID=UPI0005810469|nr:PREDICTED: uncharacterized protein LOC105143178 [Acromyrmex echinatior]
MVMDFARLKGRPRAPGPSGVHGRVWFTAAPIVSGRLRRLFTSCLRDGIFPRPWKRARLVLLRKEGKPAESPSTYRPLCLLDDAGKLLERVIAARIVRHLSRDGTNLSRGQYGFREGLSTIDAVRQVRALSEQMTAGGEVALAISLDIANAFNSIPWDRVVGAMRGHHLFPPYLVAIIEDYFRDRQLEFHNKTGLQQRRDMLCGVPQGSVLGPLLWNVAYDYVLRAALPPGCHVVCYADDMLVVVGGTTWERAVGTNVAVACVVGSIKELGIRVAPAKSEALFFHDGKSGVPPQTHIVWRPPPENDPPTTGARTVETILPCLEEWVGRGWGGLSFQATQVLTGHGCFGECLCRIGKEPTTCCHHCDGDRDTAQHTLETCPAWAGERGFLVREIGMDLSLPAVMKEIVGRESAWRTFSSFCDRVMSQKEEAERQRERAPGGRAPLPPPPPPGGRADGGEGYARVGNKPTGLRGSQKYAARVPGSPSCKARANNELKEFADLIRKSNHQRQMQKFLAEQATQWHFITPVFVPYGRNMGEARLNSRPLTPISNDPADLTALTPGNFLIGTPLSAMPQRDLIDTPTNYLMRYQLLIKLQQHLWSRWSHEYLSQLQIRRK